MGRGRAKAKQTKVARDLKYNSGGMDLNALRAELVSPHDTDSDVHDESEDDEFDDAYDEYDDEDEEADYAPGR